MKDITINKHHLIAGSTIILALIIGIAIGFCVNRNEGRGRYNYNSGRNFGPGMMNNWRNQPYGADNDVLPAEIVPATGTSTTR